MIFAACVAAIVFSIAISMHAIMRILETTPFMGIPADAYGNRIPIQGYPQLGFGVASTVLFTILGLFSECVYIGPNDSPFALYLSPRHRLRLRWD